MGLATNSEEGISSKNGWDSIETPAFVYDEDIIEQLLAYSDRLRANGRCQVLFSLKAFCFSDVLLQMAPRLDGFAVSSLFEARLARGILGDTGSVHITTPGIRAADTGEIGALCDYISFNSMHQSEMYAGKLGKGISGGIRVNPQLPFVDDDRYNPCRPHSKLGVPLEDLVAIASHDPASLSWIQGIHLHSNCESTDFGQMRDTVLHLHSQIGNILQNVKWINLGGGYLFEASENLDALHGAMDFLRSQYGLQVFLEPGAAFIQSAGYIVSTVLDLFQSEGKAIAVLDTTVNHMPEVFEYGYEPDVIGHDDDATYEYTLVGCSCLAGDIFGDYRFEQPLRVGAKVVFYNVGAYTLSKAHTFNGINLPAIYAMNESGVLALKKRYTYGDFATRWGANGSIPK